MSARYNSYKRNIYLWRRAYGTPFGFIAAYYGKCARCGNQGAHRHHKAHDYLFACILPNRFAARYLEFHADDIDYLCKRCHVNAHKIYDKLIDEFNEELNLFKGTKYNLEQVYKLCLKYKKKFLKRYESWRDSKKGKKK